MTHQLIDTDDGLSAVLKAHIGEHFVAVDTEFRRRDTFFPQPALLQLCWKETAYLIDPTKVSDLDGIVELLANPTTVKFIHSPSEDLEVFDCWLGVLPEPLFDTQRALAALGRGFGLGYRAMVETYTGEIISKEETTSDWLRRPLSTQQLSYAALDVTYLRKIGQQLYDTCADKGRLEWIFEDTRRLGVGGRGPAAKFRSAWKLTDTQQQILNALIDWRESEARRLDRPRSWLLPDKVIVALAKRRPTHLAQLGTVDGLHDSVIRKRGDQILDTIDRSSSLSATLPPAWAPPLTVDERSWAARLSEVVKQRAVELNVAPEVLCATKDVERFIQAFVSQQALPPELLGWRETAITHQLERKLSDLIARSSAP